MKMIDDADEFTLRILCAEKNKRITQRGDRA